MAQNSNFFGFFSFVDSGLDVLLDIFLGGEARDVDLFFFFWLLGGREVLQILEIFLHLLTL